MPPFLAPRPLSEAAGRSPHHRGPPPRLVGRRRERAVLREHLTEALRGRGRLVLVSGEAGIGKTTLVQALAHEAETEGARVRIGGCYDLTTTPPYGPWLEVFRAYPGGGDVPSPSQLEAGGLTGIDSQAALFDLVGRFLGRAAGDGALVLLLEDLHWADAASLDLLRYLVRGLGDYPALVIATYRDDEVTPDHPLFRLLPALVREGQAHRLVLQPLDNPAIRALVRDRYRLPAAAEERVVSYVERLAEGNPLFTTELLAALGEQRLLTPTADGWAVGDLAAAAIPSLIQQVITGRLSRLTPVACDVLAVAAVVGDEVPLELLQELHQRTAAELDDALEEALAHHVLRRQPGSQPVRFSHALVRQAIYEAIPPLRRQRLHRQTGEALANRERPDPGAVADHFAHGDDQRAVGWLLRAAEQAQALFASQTVLESCGRALALVARLGGEPPVAAYRLQGLARETIGDFDGAHAAQETALALARDHRDRQGEWQALLDLGALWASRDYGQAKDYLEQALDLARALGEPTMLGQSLNRLGNWYVNVEQPAAGLRYHQEALAVFERLADRAGTAATLDLIGMAYILTGDVARSAAYYQRAVPLLRSLDQRQTLITALATMGVTRIGSDHSLIGMRRDYPEPGSERDHLLAVDEAIQLARAIGWRAGEAFSLALSARAAQVFGDFDRAIRDSESAVRIAEEIGHRQWTALGLCSLGAIYVDLFAVDRALAHLRRARTLGLEIDSRFLTGVATSFLASVHVARGELDLARSLIQPLIDPTRPLTTTWQRDAWFVAAQLEVAGDNPEAALTILDRIEASIPGPPEPGLPSIAALRGAALMAGDRDAAETVLLKAAEVARGFGLRSTLWRILASLCTLHTKRGRRADAERVGQTALGLIEDLAGTVEDPDLRDHFLTNARALLAESLPTGSTRPSAATFGGLSPREREVLRLVARGMMDAEVGEALFISPRTVNQHLRAIYKKLDVTNRTAAVRVAADRDLL